MCSLVHGESNFPSGWKSIYKIFRYDKYDNLYLYFVYVLTNRGIMIILYSQA